MPRHSLGWWRSEKFLGQPRCVEAGHPNRQRPIAWDPGDNESICFAPHEVAAQSSSMKTQRKGKFPHTLAYVLPVQTQSMACYGVHGHVTIGACYTLTNLKLPTLTRISLALELNKTMWVRQLGTQATLTSNSPIVSTLPLIYLQRKNRMCW